MQSPTRSTRNDRFGCRKLSHPQVSRSWSTYQTYLSSAKPLTGNKGSNCGSSYVNQALKEKVIKRIKSTPYSSVPGPSLEHTIENSLMTRFEYDIKPRFEPSIGLDGTTVLPVSGLQRNQRLGFGSGTIHIPRFIYPHPTRHTLIVSSDARLRIFSSPVCKV